MKKIIPLLLISLLLTSVFSVYPAAAAKLPMAEDMGGYENLMLTYTFRTSSYDNGRHSESDLMPYTAYVDEKGNVKDFFFDSYLFLPCVGAGPSGARMHYDEHNPTKAIDWIAYVEDTFYKGTNVEALDRAYGRTKSELGDTESKAGVFFTILYPHKKAVDFGVLGGKSLDLSKTEDRKYAVKWMIDEQIARFNDGGYNNLDLVGFYWLEEFIVEDADAEILTYASDYLHSKGLKFIWIPWYKANGYSNWESYGFDVACMQPNLMWIGYNDPNRVQNSVSISKRYGMGMEMEVDYRVDTDDYFSRYLSYLEGGLNSSMMNGVKMYYQDARRGVYYDACYSESERMRSVYDLTYKYATKTLTQADIDAVRPEKVETEYKYVQNINLKDLMPKGIKWVSVGKKYSGCSSYVDGNGMDYQDVNGKELTDGKLADEILTTDWHAFHHSKLDSDGKMSITIDLEKVRTDLTTFVAHFDSRLDYGIGTPMGIELYTSLDNETFKRIALPSLYFDGTNAYFKYETEPVTARYVKMSFNLGSGSFVFCSEFLAGVDENLLPKEETSAPEPAVPNENSELAQKDENGDLGPVYLICAVAVGVLACALAAVFIVKKVKNKNKNV